MEEKNKKSETPIENETPIEKVYDLDAKSDACLDLSLRRFAYSSLAGAFNGLLLFRSPVTRWASVAFGAGVGLGSAYSDCSHMFEKPASNLRPPEVPYSPVSEEGRE